MPDHLELEPARFALTGGGFLASKLLDITHRDAHFNATTGDLGCLDAPHSIPGGSVRRLNSPHSKMMFTSVIREVYRG
jgi:hypothetical protein